MFANLMLEMLVHNISLNEISNGLGISEYDAIRKLKNELIITCAEAVTIKRIIGSELPLEELFEVVE